MKVLSVLVVLLAYCYCMEVEGNATEALVQETRATKKKSSLRLWALLALLVFSKMAVVKVVSFMMLMTFFQKLFSLAGVFLGVYMNNRSPSSTYGPPEYNTVGYSYGPPDSDKTYPGPAGQDYGLPSLNDIGGSFNNWLYNKHN